MDKAFDDPKSPPIKSSRKPTGANIFPRGDATNVCLVFSPGRFQGEEREPGIKRQDANSSPSRLTYPLQRTSKHFTLGTTPLLRTRQSSLRALPKIHFLLCPNRFLPWSQKRERCHRPRLIPLRWPCRLPDGSS